MKGQQQVNQMMGSMRDTVKVIMMDDDRLEHLRRQRKINWKISNHGKTLFKDPKGKTV